MASKSEKDKARTESIQSQVSREPKALVTLGGTAITTSGRLTRTNFFRFIGHDLDEYDEIKVTPEQARKIHNHLLKLSTGSAAMVPMFCGGQRCPFKERCPLFAIQKHPMGKQCLIEVQLMKEWIVRYFEEYEVDPNNFTEVAYINELAEIEIQLMRINMNLAKPEHSELVIDQVVGATNDGTPLVQKDISPFMELKDRLQSRRSKIIKLMVGDRQEQYKKEAALKVKMDKDPSSRMAAMRSKLEGLARELDHFQRDEEGRRLPQQDSLTPQSIIDADFEE